MSNRFQRFISLFIFIADIFFLNFSDWLSKVVYSFFHAGVAPIESYRFIILANVIWGLLVFQNYFKAVRVDFIGITKNTFTLFSYFLLITLALSFSLKLELSRLHVLLFAFFLLCFLFANRYFIYFFRKRGYLFKSKRSRVVIVGNSDISYKAAGYFSRPDSGYEFLGFFDDDNLHRNGYPLLGKVEACLPFAEHNHVHEIYSTIIPGKSDTVDRIMTESESKCIRFKYIPDFNELLHRNVQLTVENEIPVLSFRKVQLDSIENRFKKRLTDIFFTAGIFILILWWLLPILSLLVKITSKGPVLFVQKRSGKDGRVFNCYKFRSMHVNTDSDVKAASKNDKRTTKLGRFLRKTNLDELPQFYNVLKGDMSIVGPRPHMLSHTEQYRTIISKYMVRHFIKPGITGWAQVNGLRGDLTGNKMNERVKYDIWYMENWSWLLDLKIVLKTVLLTIRGDKNEF